MEQTITLNTTSLLLFSVTYFLHLVALSTSSQLATYATIGAAISTMIVNIINSIKKNKK